MAALQLREDASTGRLTMVAPLTKRLGGMGFGLLWVVFIAGFFFLPMLASESVDWTNLLFVLVILVLSGGSSLISALTTTTVTIDRGNRTMTNVLSLLAFPLRSTMLSFADLANVELQYYRQSSGRASHDAWRVIAIDKDGRRVPINWDGKQAEMADLAQKMVALTGAPLLDNSIKPESTMQRIFGRGMPPPTTDQPAQGSDYSKVGETQPEADRMPVADQRAAPPPSAPSPAESNEPWAMPMNELAQPPAPADYSVETPPAPATDLGAMSIGELEQRVQSDAMDSETRYALARKYHARGQVDRAIALYQETLRLDTTNPNA
ncbi:MAG: hypothetical protein KGJ80_16680, partial [Chloroflexota bacterium]|nr:hypothetical protein [Chloroflexota bacterium]